MELKYLSTTLIKNFKDCPSRALKSHAKRQIHGDDNEGTNATRFGTVVHSVMETVHHLTMIDQKPSDQRIIELYKESWSNSTCTDPDLFRLGLNGIVAYVKRSVTKRIGETIAVELDFVYEVETKQIFLPQEDTRFTRALFVDEIRARGNTPIVSKIDRIDRVSDVEFEVYDYKTNIMPFTREEIETSEQLGIYDLAVRALYPEAQQVWCVFDMFRHGRFPTEFDDEFRDNLSAYLIALDKQMHAAIPAPEERINKYCRWCEIRGTCKAYRDALESPLPPILTENQDTPEGFNALYEEGQRLADLMKMAKERREEINKAVIAKIEKDGFGDPIQVGPNEYYLMSNARYKYSPDDVIALLSEKKCMVLLPKIVSVSKPSLEATFKTRPEILEELKKLEDKYFVSPTPKKRKLKAGKIKDGADPDANTED